MSLNRKAITQKLGLYQSNGLLHTTLVRDIMIELEIDPCGKDSSKCFMYDESVLSKIRSWFWKNFKGDLPGEVWIRCRKYVVIYLPDYEEIKKSA